MIKKQLKITSKIVLNALLSKHWQDIAISECKTGSSDRGNVRIDLWTMKKSWANPLTIAYEIKVNRNDFLNDKKWPNYIPYCNELYFVCPSKMIQPNEVPENCGLMWISTTGTRVYTKKKAPYRNVDIPEDLYRYIMMWRTRVTREHTQMSMKEFWKNWLIKKEINHEFGWKIGKAIKETVNTKIHDVDYKNKQLSEDIKKYDNLLEFLKKINIDPNNYWLHDSVEKKLDSFNKIISQDLEDSLEHAHSRLSNVLETIKLHRKKEEKCEKTRKRFRK